MTQKVGGLELCKPQDLRHLKQPVHSSQSIEGTDKSATTVSSKFLCLEDISAVSIRSGTAKARASSGFVVLESLNAE